MRKLQVMIDLETLSTRSDACIISIGAVKFDETGIKDTFYTNVKAKSCLETGLHVSKETIEWWKTQSQEAIEHLKLNQRPIQEALSMFDSWYGMSSLLTWGNGSAFDNVILENAYRIVKDEPAPWKYWDSRCYRTVKALFDQIPIDPFEGVKHDALSDAKHQANHLIKILNS